MIHSVPVVSDHAVVRWLDRIKGLGADISLRFPEGFGEELRANFGCSILGISIDEAKATILPKRLHEGVMYGARAVLAHDQILICDRGLVLTCLERDMWRRLPVFKENQ